MQSKRKRRGDEKGAVQLLEESFHLLRLMPATSYLALFAGMVPFALGALYFFTDMSRSGTAVKDAPMGALFLVLLYLLMRMAQARFCSALWERISPGQQRRLHFREKISQLGALCLLQAFHLPLLVAATFFAVPFAWVVAALQNSVVLSLTQDYRRKPFRLLLWNSLKHSKENWVQNHAILLILGFVSLFLWINLVATCIMIPTFAKSFFGVDSVFTTSPTAAVLNLTFLSATLLITWMVLSPVFKAIYTLRCFHAESRSTGADLISRLQSVRSSRPVAHSLAPSALAVLCACLLFPPTTTQAIEAPGSPPPPPAMTSTIMTSTITSEEFGRQLSQTLEQKKYQWRFSRQLDLLETREETWVEQGMRQIALTARKWMESISEFFQKLFNSWLERNQKTRPSPQGESWGGIHGEQIRSILSIGIGVLIGIGLLVLLWVLHKRGAFRKKERITRDGISAPIDLESEDIVATQLPEDEWLKLAREQMEKGDARLAIRAIFLATLAHLGDRGVVRIARFKSNRDYTRELELKARSEQEMRQAFQENVIRFEEVWYGLHQLGDQALEHFIHNHERIARQLSASAPLPGHPLTS